MSVSTKTLHILGFFSPLHFKEGDNLLTTLNANKVGIAQSCGAMGSCTTCRVFVRKGLEHCSPRTEIELERATERSFEDHERLACQTQMFGDLEIEILNMEEPED